MYTHAIIHARVGENELALLEHEKIRYKKIYRTK